MPHDAFGYVLKVGDEVVIPAVITQLNEGEDFCNVSLSTFHGRKPDGNKENICAINTAVCEKTLMSGEQLQGISPAVIPDASALIADFIAISKTSEGQQLIADALKLIADFGIKKPQ